MSTLEIILGAYSLIMSVLVAFIMRRWGYALDGWRETLDLLDAVERIVGLAGEQR